MKRQLTRLSLGLVLALLVMTGLIACRAATVDRDQAREPADWMTMQREPAMRSAASFDNRQPTGVAVTEDGRVFVNFPRWERQHDLSVALVREDGSLVPYPDRQWNRWAPGSGLSPDQHFVCVQSVWADRDGNLWILDPAASMLEQVVEGGPKLVRVNLDTDRVERVYNFNSDIAPQNSYLNDVRVDNRRGHAYMTDSGTGALVVLNLETGQARRVLADHPSTQADEDLTLVVNGQPLRDRQGQTPRIHADGIALSPDGETLYYHALTGRTLYRIPTDVLRDFDADDEELADAVERVAETVVTDGMLMDHQGNVYHTAIEHNAIMAYNVRDGQLHTLVHDPRLQWPDSLSIGPDGSLYVTTSQIHKMPRFNEGRSTRDEPYHVYRIDTNLRQEQ